MDQTHRICSRCILPETYPGIRFDDEGVCSHCRRQEAAMKEIPAKKAAYRERLDRLVMTVKGQGPVYDAIVAYSGGKDSSYTLKLLKDVYGLRILALVFDNHFISHMAWENIKTVTDRMDVDVIRFRPPWPVVRDLFQCTARRDIFPAPTLLRASAVCTACIGLVKSVVLKTALEMSIPLVAFGWSPGQAPIQSAIMKTNPGLIQRNQSVLKKAYPPDVRRSLAAYYIPEPYYALYADRFPHNIHPLAFFDYDEEKVKARLDTLGWRAPSDTDTNSTNCLLNAFANQCHLDRHGFHPYVWEIANMVRQGILGREEGMEKIYAPQDPEMVAYARKRLGL